MVSPPKTRPTLKKTAHTTRIKTPAAVRHRFAKAGLKSPFARLFKVLFIGLMLLAAYVLLAWFKPINVTQNVFTVEPNASYNQIVEQLGADGHIISPFWLKVYRKLFLPESLQAGEYDVGERISPVALLSAIGGKGKHSLLEVRVIEGKTVAFVRKQLANDSRIKQTIAALSDQQVLAKIAGDDANKPPFLEGMLAPNTYYFTRKVQDIDVLKRLYQDQQHLLDKAWQDRAPNLLYKNKWELLIMASIVEKESSMVDEQGRIAGVFMTRLRQGMKLQTDPTVIYGMGDSYFGKISRSDLQRPTPYNTYVINGLPPTPIALPSKSALMAAAKPEETGDLFFVASGYGGHVFNKTYAKHQVAVDAYWALMAQRRAARAAAENPQVNGQIAPAAIGQPAQAGSAGTQYVTAPSQAGAVQAGQQLPPIFSEQMPEINGSVAQGANRAGTASVGNTAGGNDGGSAGGVYPGGSNTAGGSGNSTPNLPPSPPPALAIPLQQLGQPPQR